MLLFGETKLAKAISKGDNARVKELLQLGVNPNASRENAWEDPFLEHALQSKNPQAAIYLIEAGCTQRFRTYSGGSIVYYAVKKGYIDVAEAFLEKHPDFLASTTYTPLHEAACDGELAAAQFFLAHGVDAESRDGDNRTPLYYAQKNNRDQLIALLKPSEKSPDDKNEWQKLADAEIAHMSFHTATGMKITDIFNFATSERRTICLDTVAKTQSTETRPFNECSAAAVQNAHDELKNRNGLKKGYDGFSLIFKG